MGAGAGALVGVGDRAAVLEAPFAGGRDRAVDAARAGGGRRDDAAVRRIVAVRDLHHHGHARAPAMASPLEGDVFVAGDQAFARGHGAVRRDVRPVQHAVAAARRRIDQGAVVVIDREPPQFLGGGVERIGKARRGRATKPGLAQPRGQEVVGDAVIMRVLDAIAVVASSPRGRAAGREQNQRRRREIRCGIFGRNARSSSSSPPCVLWCG